MTPQVRRSILIVLGVLLAGRGGGVLATTSASTKSVEESVLAIHTEMTRAGEAVDADRLFSYMLDTDKGSVVQNGAILTTRREALDQVRENLRGIRSIEYRWKRQYVTVLSSEAALLVAEGDSVATTAVGETFTTRFVQTVVFVLTEDGWRAVHAHQSSPSRF